MSAEEASEIIQSEEFASFEHVSIVGLMGMATFTDDLDQVKKEFQYLKSTFDNLKKIETTNSKLQSISMGMSGDYPLAIDCGSTMVRVGSRIFGARN
jgi:uncharacterized pyridoxal phosphate-containing UPF0001 family protein